MVPTVQNMVPDTAVIEGHERSENISKWAMRDYRESLKLTFLRKTTCSYRGSLLIHTVLENRPPTVNFYT